MLRIVHLWLHGLGGQSGGRGRRTAEPPRRPTTARVWRHHRPREQTSRFMQQTWTILTTMALITSGCGQSDLARSGMGGRRGGALRGGSAGGRGGGGGAGRGPGDDVHGFRPPRAGGRAAAAASQQHRKERRGFGDERHELHSGAARKGGASPCGGRRTRFMTRTLRWLLGLAACDTPMRHQGSVKHSALTSVHLSALARRSSGGARYDQGDAWTQPVCLRAGAAGAVCSSGPIRIHRGLRASCLGHQQSP